MGKGQLFDQWLGMLFASSTTPNGEKKPINTNMMNDQVAFFHREGVREGAVAKRDMGNGWCVHGGSGVGIEGEEKGGR